jgi:hypothetical protein
MKRFRKDANYQFTTMEGGSEPFDETSPFKVEIGKQFDEYSQIFSSASLGVVEARFQLIKNNGQLDFSTQPYPLVIQFHPLSELFEFHIPSFQICLTIRLQAEKSNSSGIAN